MKVGMESEIYKAYLYESERMESRLKGERLARETTGPITLAPPDGSGVEIHDAIFTAHKMGLEAGKAAVTEHQKDACPVESKSHEQIVAEISAEWRPEWPCTCRGGEQLCEGCRFNLVMIEELKRLLSKALEFARMK